ncbi:MAG TPA: ISKra4 family transposase [Chloroflexota bacterium]|jgi:hypothetical protein
MNTLPPPIVAALETLGSELVTWAQEHRDSTLVDQEQAVLERVRAALPRLLGAVLTLSMRQLEPGLRRLPATCPTCGRRCRRPSWRRRWVTTICGRMTWERPWYHCRGCQHGWSPVDHTLGVAPRARLSGGLQQWLAELGAATDFAEAQGWLERLGGVHVAKETVRTQAERQGAALEAAQQAASAQVEATRESALPVDAAPGQLLVETDGVMVRYQKTGWHEVKIGLVAGWVDGALAAPSYVAAREGAAAFGDRLLGEAARRGALEIVGWEGGRTGAGLAVLRDVLVLGDGARWIWTLAAEHFGARREVVDFYHASEHLWTVARLLESAGTAVAAEWGAARCHELRHDGVDPVRTALRAARATTADGRKLLRRERAYFRTNAARMDYPAAKADGLPIGSGAVESLARHLVQLRMKRPGARWSRAGAQAIVTLRAHLKSGRPLLCRAEPPAPTQAPRAA